MGTRDGVRRRWVLGRTIIAILVLLLVATGLDARNAWAEDSSAWAEEVGEERLVRRVQTGFEDLRQKPRFYWDRGPTLATPKEAFALHVGWEIQADLIWYSEPNRALQNAIPHEFNSGPYLRRNRLSFEGFLLRDWYVRVRYGWDGPFELQFQDAFVEFSGLRNGRFTKEKNWMPAIRVGQLKEAMTIDWMNNAKWPLFAERAMFTTSIIPNRTPGVRAHGTAFDRRMTYQVGAYNADSELSPNTPGEGQAITGRLTGIPWSQRGTKQRFLHLGVSSTWRWDVGDVQFDARPESWLAEPVVETGILPTDTMRSTAVEALFQYDRFTAIFEGAWTTLDLKNGQTSDYYGWYGAFSYYLTPPGLNFNREFGVISRVRPKCTLVKPSNGWGAFEVTGRYSMLDLDAQPSPGGFAESVTLGLNWYPRDNMRVTFNYIHTWIQNAYGDPNGDGTLDTLMLRLQYDL